MHLQSVIPLEPASSADGARGTAAVRVAMVLPGNSGLVYLAPRCRCPGEIFIQATLIEVFRVLFRLVPDFDCGDRRSLAIVAYQDNLLCHFFSPQLLSPATWRESDAGSKPISPFPESFICNARASYDRGTPKSNHPVLTALLTLFPHVIVAVLIQIGVPN